MGGAAGDVGRPAPFGSPISHRSGGPELVPMCYFTRRRRMAVAAVLALRMTSSASRRIPLSAILLVGSVVSMACASRRIAAPDYGIPPCPAVAQRDLFSPDALQCWFTAPHGRWRRLDHQSHLEALVVFVEARDVRDAEAIARQLVADHAARAYSEILTYVHPERPDVTSRVRRVRWTRDGAFETLDF